MTESEAGTKTFFPNRVWKLSILQYAWLKMLKHGKLYCNLLTDQCIWKRDIQVGGLTVWVLICTVSGKLDKFRPKKKKKKHLSESVTLKLYVWYTESPWFTHTLHPAVDRELKMAAMRAHNIGFYKPSLWHVWCQVIYFSWCGSHLLDVHFELSIITFKTEKSLRSCNEVHDNSSSLIRTVCRLVIMLVDVVVGFVLLVLSHHVLARHTRNYRQMSWGSLGNGGIAAIQQKLAIIDDPCSCSRNATFEWLSEQIWINAVTMQWADFIQMFFFFLNI